MKLSAALVVAVATLTTLAACASGAQSHSSSPLPSSGGAASASAGSSSSGPGLDARGMVVKALGEETRFGPDQAHPVVTLTIDSIAPVACDDPYVSHQPINGHFIGAHMRLSAAPAGVDRSGAPTEMNPADFSFVGSNGVTVPGSVIADSAARTCLSVAQAFPSGRFVPGKNYVGTVAFDLPEEHGALIYRPGGLSHGSGWEWDF